MQWTEDGIVLGARKHAESAVIVQLFTPGHGRHAGLVRGGAGTRARGIYQTGNRVTATWRARLEEHLGSYTCELTGAVAAGLLEDPLRLAALSSAAALAEAALPERLAYPGLYRRFSAWLDLLGGDDGSAWQASYVDWELALLAELGYGLDLSECAGGGGDDLIYVSPKSARAVSREQGADYAGRLLPLPAFVRDPGRDATAGDIAAGLALAGHFLERHLFASAESVSGGIPPARARFAARMAKQHMAKKHIAKQSDTA